MSHLTEGSIQAYLDGELDVAASVALREHLGACTSCAADLDELKVASQVTGGALAQLDAGVMMPTLRARAAIAAARRQETPAAGGTEQESAAGWTDAPDRPAGRHRRFAAAGIGGLARAAMLLLALAGAGAAAIPGSPVRRALDATVARVAQLFSGDPSSTAAVDTPVEPAAEAPLSTEWAAITAANGRVRVQLHTPDGVVDVTVRLVDAHRANVETVMEEGEVRFLSGTGRLEVLGLGKGSVVIEIPRTLPNAAIQVAGLVHVYKDGDQLRLTGPAGDGQGSEVRFRIGS